MHHPDRKSTPVAFLLIALTIEASTAADEASVVSKPSKAIKADTVRSAPTVAQRRERFQELVKDHNEIKKPQFERRHHTTFSLHGWTVHLNDKLWQSEDGVAATRTMLKLLSGQFDRVVKAVPAAAVSKLRKVPVWINPEYENEQPRCEYHPGAAWLRNNGRDPVMEKAIEITNVSNFTFENKRMPYLMLHELAHGYHDQVLSFDEPRIIAAFAAAKKSGGYESVKRFTGRKIVTDKAYALSNHKEYFAETTEAYFGKNDFYPFDKAELRAHDPIMHELLGELWGVAAQPKAE